MNIILGIISMFVIFSSLVLIEKIFKKEGLYIWVCFATITANIIVCKTINILGFVSTLGNIMFASNYLATDIMSEKYGSKDSKKAIILGATMQVLFIVITQLALLFIPDKTDVAHQAMYTLFKMNMRVSLASVFMYLVSNLFDIYLYEKIKNKVPNKMWLRNNVSTIISNCLENFIFNFLAFYPIFDVKTIISIGIIGSAIEILVALFDTPFLYISKKLK
jgi:hypothetical protein